MARMKKLCGVYVAPIGWHFKGRGGGLVRDEDAAQPIESHPGDSLEAAYRAAFNMGVPRNGFWRLFLRTAKKSAPPLARLTLFVVIVTAGIQGWQIFVIRDQERQQLRAYLSVEPVSEPLIIPPLSLIGSAMVHNNGSTPANDLIVQLRIALAPVASLKHLDYQTLLLPSPFSDYGSIFPQKDKDVQTEEVLDTSDADKRDFDAGKIVVLVLGTLSYTDAFHFNRHTDFCWYYGKSTVGINQVQFCAAHNGAT